MEPEILYYDGDCGFCHRTVRFVIALDRGEAFRFAPIDGSTFHGLRRGNTGFDTYYIRALSDRLDRPMSRRRPRRVPEGGDRGRSRC